MHMLEHYLLLPEPSAHKHLSAPFRFSIGHRHRTTQSNVSV